MFQRRYLGILFDALSRHHEVYIREFRYRKMISGLYVIDGVKYRKISFIKLYVNLLSKTEMFSRHRLKNF